MPISVTHTFVSPVTDAGDPNEVGPVEWNAAHTVTGAVAASAESYNRVVNGAMQVTQENGNTAGTTVTYYGADQWMTNKVHSAGTMTTQRVQAVTPNGSADRYRLTVTSPDTSLAAGEYLIIEQYIEGVRVADFRYGSASAKQAVLRFGLKAPAGTYSVVIRNNAYDRTYVALFTVSAANTDTEYTLVIPGDTTGTWLTDTGAGLRLTFTFACGSTFQGTTGWQAGGMLGTSAVTNGMGTTSNVFELYDVGLYLDPQNSGVAPRWQMPNYADELQACERYWQFTKGNLNASIWYHIMLRTVMRTTPAIATNVTNTAEVYPGSFSNFNTAQIVGTFTLTARM
jgi:hypothetical protein